MANTRKTLQLASVSLKHFRCFKQQMFELDSPVVLIHGMNGSGKTSLLEALYYACYLRSFRTHLSRDLISFGTDTFFVKVHLRDNSFEQHLESNIQVGFAGSKRLVKVNQKAVSSYKELMHHYRIVSLTEDDLALIKGSPQIRRTFIDQAILLSDYDFIAKVRDFRTILENRNAMLKLGVHNDDTYALWTQQLWECTQVIQHERKKLLAHLERTINTMLTDYFDNAFTISFSYSARKSSDTVFDSFWSNKDQLLSEEVRFGRSLFGAHLDDVIIKLQGKRSKSFSSRGQQKMIILLIKIAQIKQLSVNKSPAIFLLDDFMTDFDPERAQVLLSILLDLDNQLIFTSPAREGVLENSLKAHGTAVKMLTI